MEDEDKMLSMMVGWVSRRRASFGTGLALVLVAAGTAAGTSGAMLHLGVGNTRNATTTLTGSTSGPEMRITNNGTGPALALGVDSNRPALSVHSSARIANLNADKVDGIDSTAFLRGPLRYVVVSQVVRAGAWGEARARCPAGTRVLGGGVSTYSGDTVEVSAPDGYYAGTMDTWRAIVRAGPADSTIQVTAICSAVASYTVTGP